MDFALRVAAASLVALGSAAPSHAAPAYPRTQSRVEIARWLQSATDLPLAKVVLVGPGYVFAFQSGDAESTAAGLVWKQVREEVTSPAMESRLNGRSATASIAFDCVRNQATASNVVVYAGNNLGGDQGRSAPAADWLVANPGLYLMDLAKAACDPAFRRPLIAQPLPAAAEPDPAPPINEPPNRVTVVQTGPERWVQVGAFAGAAAANQRWRAIQLALPARSAGRTLKTEPVSGGKTLVRALIGPFHGADAQAFCTALKAQRGDCLVR